MRRDSTATAAPRAVPTSARGATEPARAPFIPHTFGEQLDDPAHARRAFAQSIASGLADRPRHLSCAYLYDERGSELFERITETPEYYLTRAETEILRAHAGEIRALAGPTTLVELGSGTSAKTRHLLAAWTAAGPATYVAVDICAAALERGCERLRDEFPGLEVHAVAASYDQAIPRLGAFSPLTLAFLGSTIGNFDDRELDVFLESIATSLAPGDAFLVGLDLVKDRATLEAAYDDAAGVTASFTRNLFARMNRELGTGLDLDAIEHVAWYDEALERIEIYARFRDGATIELRELERSFRIAPGELVRTEISRKFRPDEVAARAAEHGFEPVRAFTDREERFAVLLLRLARSPRDPARVRARARRELEAVRGHTFDLIAPLDETRLRRQHSPLMSPIVWDLAHIGNFEEQWVTRVFPDLGSSAAERAARDRIYDPTANPRATRSRLPLLDRTRCLDYLGAVRRLTLESVRRIAPESRDPLHSGAYLHAMVAQHEAQHCETILQAIGLMNDVEYEPAWRVDPPRARRRLPSGQAIVPAGPFLVGTDDRQVAYDNERPAHVIDVPRFRIDLSPVSNAEFLSFVADGGYRRRELWTEDGWSWLREARISSPGGWLRGSDGRWCERRFGRTETLDPRRPVIHVSWYEADAYARWAGKRLPTEFEWEKAAACDLERGIARRYPWGGEAPTADRANLDQRTFGPAEIGAYPDGQSFFGCHQMLGDVWEWTASEFLPYPGFEAFPYAEYSAIHFGKGYRVLRGGSWATRSLAIRNTFRNWDLPQRRQIFAGIRCASDA